MPDETQTLCSIRDRIAVLFGIDLRDEEKVTPAFSNLLNLAIYQGLSSEERGKAMFLLGIQKWDAHVKAEWGQIVCAATIWACHQIERDPEWDSGTKEIAGEVLVTCEIRQKQYRRDLERPLIKKGKKEAQPA
jgi:hypothetical protein